MKTILVHNSASNHLYEVKEFLGIDEFIFPVLDINGYTGQVIVVKDL